MATSTRLIIVLYFSSQLCFGDYFSSIGSNHFVDVPFPIIPQKNIYNGSNHRFVGMDGLNVSRLQDICIQTPAGSWVCRLTWHRRGVNKPTSFVCMYQVYPCLILCSFQNFCASVGRIGQDRQIQREIDRQIGTYI